MKSLWLEFCLKMRVLRSALMGALAPQWVGAITPEARLYARVIRADGSAKNLGLIGTKVVTTAFVNFLTDQLQAETTEVGDFKFHDSGTGTTAENVANTAMETKVESGRATGSQEEGASPNIYRSIGTITYTGTHAVTEHGLFSQASGGTLMDRTVFAAINVVADDSIQFTYELTLPAGS